MKNVTINTGITATTYTIENKNLAKKVYDLLKKTKATDFPMLQITITNQQ